jgi:hypothetical protein
MGSGVARLKLKAQHTKSIPATRKEVMSFQKEDIFSREWGFTGLTEGELSLS